MVPTKKPNLVLMKTLENASLCEQISGVGSNLRHGCEISAVSYESVGSHRDPNEHKQDLFLVVDFMGWTGGDLHSGGLLEKDTQVLNLCAFSFF